MLSVATEIDPIILFPSIVAKSVNALLTGVRLKASHLRKISGSNFVI